MAGFRYWAAIGVLSLASIAGQFIVADARAYVRVEPASSCDIPVAATPTTSGESHHSPAETIPFDLLFIDRMTAYQAGAIAIANEALQRTQDSYVRRIALRIAESRAGEIQLLKYWRDTWYPGAEQTIDHDVELDTPSREMSVERAIAALCSAKGNFDQVFLEVMLAHSQATIEVVENSLSNAEHAEIVAFAESIVAAQSDEMAMMSRWLESMDPTPRASS